MSVVYNNSKRVAYMAMKIGKIDMQGYITDASVSV